MAEETFVISKQEGKDVNSLVKAMMRGSNDVPDMLGRRLLPIVRNIAELARRDVPRRTGHGAGSIVPGDGKRSMASIKFGGNAAPYQPWLDFGGSVGKGHRSTTSKSGKPLKGIGGGSVYRERIKGGRYVYPTIIQEMPHTLKLVETAIADTFLELDFSMKEYD